MRCSRVCLNPLCIFLPSFSLFFFLVRYYEIDDLDLCEMRDEIGKSEDGYEGVEKRRGIGMRDRESV